MLGLFKKKSLENDIVVVTRALSPKVVVVVSASCCMRGAAEVDTQAEVAARAAIEQANLDWPVLTITVTQAQSTLSKISGELDAAQSALAAQVSELFMTHGLGAFPVLLVNQRLISYGGAPDRKLILEALPLALDAEYRKAANENPA